MHYTYQNTLTFYSALKCYLFPQIIKSVIFVKVLPNA